MKHKKEKEVSYSQINSIYYAQNSILASTSHYIVILSVTG